MKEFIAQNGGILGVLILVCVVLNFLLSGLSKALEVIVTKTATQADDKFLSAINKVAAVLQKIIDWGSANRPH